MCLPSRPPLTRYHLAVESREQDRRKRDINSDNDDEYNGARNGSATLNTRLRPYNLHGRNRSFRSVLITLSTSLRSPDQLRFEGMPADGLLLSCKIAAAGAGSQLLPSQHPRLVGPRGMIDSLTRQLVVARGTNDPDPSFIASIRSALRE